MKKVITYGSFDLFHEGHYNILKRARELGDYLIVGVTTEQYDETRGKLNIIDSLDERIENVKRTGLADKIIVEDHVGQKVEDVQKYQVDVFVIGSDWMGAFDHLKDYCEVVYLERTRNVSSTMLRSKQHSIIRIGIIGTGRIAERFVPEAKYVSGITVQSVYNPHINSARNFAEGFELDLYSDDIERFLKSVDAVYIASPHETHYEYAKIALENHKHVRKAHGLSKGAGAGAFFACTPQQQGIAGSHKDRLLSGLCPAHRPGEKRGHRTDQGRGGMLYQTDCG